MKEKNEDGDSAETTMVSSANEKSQTTTLSAGASSSASNGESKTKTSTDALDAGIINGKAKPNRQLLEKLKEEMRKLKKPTTQNEKSNENESESTKQQTLLTIPPLLLGDSEFKLSSCNYLMSADSSSANAAKDDEDGKIMLCENSNDPGFSGIQLSTDFDGSSNYGLKYKRRKLNDSNEGKSDSEDDSSSGSDEENEDASYSESD